MSAPSEDSHASRNRKRWDILANQLSVVDSALSKGRQAAWRLQDQARYLWRAGADIPEGLLRRIDILWLIAAWLPEELLLQEVADLEDLLLRRIGDELDARLPPEFRRNKPRISPLPPGQAAGAFRGDPILAEFWNEILDDSESLALPFAHRETDFDTA